MRKTALSFYMDDTSPYHAGVEPYKIFLDFVAAEGVKGESSVIIGLGWNEYGLLSRPTSRLQEEFVEQALRSFECGLDTHMEIMTHEGLFDFESLSAPEGAIHEGVWLHDPQYTAENYETYFRHILDEGDRIGLQFTGLTWPGCDCDDCTWRYAELEKNPPIALNPGVSQALLSLAKQQRLRGRTVPLFLRAFDGNISPKALDGNYGVYELPPSVRGDRFHLKPQATEATGVDYYIDARESGHIVEQVRAGAPYCLFYTHWQQVNPAKGVGWDDFRQLVARVQRHLADQVVWMRPSEYTELCHPLKIE